MNVFITGNHGLIGSSLESRLINEGHKIVGSIDIRDGRKNITKINSLKLKDKVDLMIHTAAQCKINQSIAHPELTFHSDVLGTYEVFEFVRKNKISEILYFSSSRVLSKEQNPYTAAKLYGESLCRAYKDSYNIDYTIVRPSTVYGPFWDKTERLMHVWITNALEGKPIEIYGDPKTKTLDFTYIDDFVEAIILTLSGPKNQEYNISGNEEYNIYKLAKEIIKKTNSSSKIIIKSPEIAQPQKVSCDLSQIKKVGYIPKVSLSQGIDRCIEFYKNQVRK